MRTNRGRFAVVALLAVGTVGWPTSSSSQVLDPCTVRAALAPPAPFGHEVTGSATYSCTSKHFVVSVAGCLLLNGVPVECDGRTRTDALSATVDLSFPCVPGVWTTLAIGTGADRTLPATDVDGPQVVTDCDPLSP